jgi:DNA-directed RNA polymerase subunit RPC12/RpoP
MADFHDDCERLLEDEEQMDMSPLRCPECGQKFEYKRPFSAVYRWDSDYHALTLGPTGVLIVVFLMIYLSYLATIWKQ